MKNKNCITKHCFLTMLLSLFALAFTGCTEDKVEYTSFDVSGDSYTFDGGGVQTYKIEVKSPLDGWKYTVEGDWVTIVAKDATSLTIGAQINTLPTERSGKVVFTAGTQTLPVVVRQLPLGVASYRLIDDFTPAAMSPGGIYCGGAIATTEGKITSYTPVIIEMATGERTELEVMSKSFVIRAITDKGDMICTVGNKTNVLRLDGTTVVPIPPAGCKRAVIEAVSADGSVMVGYTENKSMYYPVKWTSLEAEGELLESPETNSWGDPLQNGVMARGCSADGSIIYGTEWDNMSPVYWTTDGKVHHAGADLFKKERGIILDGTTETEVEFYIYAILSASVNNMSPNGKYLAFGLLKPRIVDKQGIVSYYAVLFNTETGQSTVVEEYDDAGGQTAMNDGTLSIIMPAQLPQTGAMYNPNTGVLMSTSQWVKQKYNLIMSEDMPIVKISSDEKSVLLWRPKKTMFGATYLFSYITYEE